MANLLGPDPLQSTFFIPGTNTPGNGVLLFTYSAGTSTKVTVYKTLAGTAHTNPIVLDSGGGLPGGTQLWIPDGVTIKAVYAPANDTDPPGSPYLSLDNLSGASGGSSSSTEWVAGPAPTYISGTSFSLVGDQTSTFQVGRRVKTTNTAGTIYSRITASVFGVVTTVTVVNDSGVLDAGLSAVSYSVQSALNPSQPLLTDFYPVERSSSNSNILLNYNLQNLTSSVTIALRASSSVLTLSDTKYTKQIFSTASTGTYLTPANVKMLHVRTIGGGGGGAASPQGTAGSNGTTTIFGTMSSAGGGGVTGVFGGSGGLASGGDINIVGSYGAPVTTTSPGGAGGIGGSGAFGGGGAAGYGSAGSLGASTSGGGGGGAGGQGPGGGAGGYVESYIANPATSYVYTVGTGGAGGTSTFSGGRGGSGIIIVEELY